MNFNKGHYEPIRFPLNMRALGTSKTMLVNPRNGNRHGVPAPSAVGSDAHNEQMQKLLEGRLDVERDIWPERYLEYCDLPSEIPGFMEMAGLDKGDPQEAGYFVQMDKPSELWNAILDWAIYEEIPLKSVELPAEIRSIAPRNTGVGADFLGMHVYTTLIYSYYVAKRMEIAFDVKYYYGQPRPEEITGCPDYGLYPCPEHPEYPAGHGTFAGVAYDCFKALFDAEAWQLQDVENGTKLLAHLRDAWAGVHVRESSLMGWRIGTGEFD